MHLWRLCSAAHADLSGEGGIKASARWHTRGRRVLYTSATAALAVLESLVHYDPALAPRDLVLLQMETPSGCSTQSVAATSLPRNWRPYPAPKRLQELGDAWLRSGNSLLLAVPSVILPGELNYLINPEHAEATRVRIISKTRFTFDPRLSPSGR